MSTRAVANQRRRWLEFFQWSSSYGTESASKPRVPTQGACQVLERKKGKTTVAATGAHLAIRARSHLGIRARLGPPEAAVKAT